MGKESENQRVELSDVFAICKQIAAINSVPLEQTQIYKNGRLFEIDPDYMAQWKKGGLSNWELYAGILSRQDDSSSETIRFAPDPKLPNDPYPRKYVKKFGSRQFFTYLFLADDDVAVEGRMLDSWGLSIPPNSRGRNESSLIRNMLDGREVRRVIMHMPNCIVDYDQTFRYHILPIYLMDRCQK